MNFDIEYVPWAKENLDYMLENYAKGKFTILDLEVSARCYLTSKFGGCIYCDSRVGRPDHNELKMKETSDLLYKASKIGVNWLYICGRGEPKDDPKIMSLIRLCRSLGINISMFTNGVNYSEDDVEFLYINNVHLIVKCDSLDASKFNILLGTPGTDIAHKIYNTINRLLDVGYCRSSGPSMALSIVPTRINLNDIPDVIKYCKRNNIFPLIAELECAGKGKKIYPNLSLSKSQLLALKKEIEEILNCKYEIPVCPAGIGGIHITNTGECVVHQGTGLSCPWFYLAEPKIVSLGNIRMHSLKELTKKILDYRQEHLKHIKYWIRKCSRNVFGGCGGKKLLKTYLAIHGRE